MNADSILFSSAFICVHRRPLAFFLAFWGSGSRGARVRWPPIQMRRARPGHHARHRRIPRPPDREPPVVQSPRRSAGGCSLYFTPCIKRTVGLIMRASTMAATMLKPVLAPNRVGSGIELYIEAALPASQLPMLLVRNQMPMMNPAARAGASFVMALSPTGLRRSEEHTSELQSLR